MQTYLYSHFVFYLIHTDFLFTYFIFSY
uniref:Uncharacterized protein n=1 Tax=Rhizophora mucronata TaxID=61149 RepID=A0A2P2J118_RHIMU